MTRNPKESSMPSNRKATKEEFLTLAQAAPRLRLDATSVGRRARRGEFGKTWLRPIRGKYHRCITKAGLERWKARQKKGR